MPGGRGGGCIHGPYLPDPLSPLCGRIPPGPGICCPLSCPLGSSQVAVEQGPAVLQPHLALAASHPVFRADSYRAPPAGPCAEFG